MRKYLFLPFILLLFAVFTHAHAATEQIEAIYKWRFEYPGETSLYYDSPTLACEALAPIVIPVLNANPNVAQKDYAFVGITAQVANTGNCTYRNSQNFTATYVARRYYTCPGNLLYYQGQQEKHFCTVPVCEPPTVRLPDGSCSTPPPNCDDKAGQIVSSGYYDIGTVPTNSMPPGGCHRGCITSPVGDSPVGRQLVNGKYHYFARGHYELTSISCEVPGDAEPGLGGIPGPTCGAGQTMGNNGGKTTCTTPNPSDPGSTKPDNPHTPDSPTPPDQTTEEKDPPVTNPDGSVSQTTRTTNPDGSTTTTTTTTNPDGSSSTTTTRSPAPTDPTKTEDPLKDFCTSNPNNKLCKETDERSWGRPDGVGKEFDIPTKDEEIEAKKDEFKLLLEQIRGEIEQLFNWSGAGGGGQLGCSGSVSILGANFQICLGPYSEQLSQIASGLVFLSLIMALFIILV